MSCPRLLATPLAVHDVRDLESHVRALVDLQLGLWNAKLDATMYEDLLAYLLATAWAIALRYEPSSSLAFSTFSRRILRLRIVDWYRDAFGASRYNLNGLEISYESLRAAHHDLDEDASWLDRNSPTAKPERVDELHRAAYVDDIDDMLTSVALESL